MSATASARRKLFLALPIYGPVDPFFMTSLMKTQTRRPCDMVVSTQIGDSLVSRARNVLASRFLESDCTHLMFVDSDIIFSADLIARLLSREVDLVGGLYPKKQRELSWVANAIPGRDMTPDERGLVPVRYIGTGFMLIARRVLERMASELDIAYDPDDGEDAGKRYAFFDAGVYRYPDGTRRYLSEDWLFCQRWLDLGGEVHADPTVVLKHCGHFIYPVENPFEARADTAADNV